MPNKKSIKSSKKKLPRLVKGSKAAKEHMAKLRAMRGKKKSHKSPKKSHKSPKKTKGKTRRGDPPKRRPLPVHPNETKEQEAKRRSFYPKTPIAETKL